MSAPGSGDIHIYCLNLIVRWQRNVILNRKEASFVRVVRPVLEPGPLCTKRQHVLPQNLVKSRSHEIPVYTFPITLKFNRHLGSSTAEKPVKFQSDTIIITSNLVASRLREF